MPAIGVGGFGSAGGSSSGGGGGGGGGSLIASIGAAGISAGLAAADSGAARRFSRQQRWGSQGWNLRLDMTQAQRRMNDYRRAGLNPMLGFSSGGGGLSGASAQGSRPGQTAVGGVGASAVGGFNALMGRRRILAEVKKLEAATKTEGTQQRVNDALEVRNTAEAASARALTKRLGVQTQHEQYELPGAQATAEFDASPEGKKLRQLNRFLDSVLGRLPGGLFSPRSKRRGVNDGRSLRSKGRK